MSTPEQPGPGQPGQDRPPTEEEIRAAMDAQMAQVTVQDMLLQSVASLINLAARRMLKADERDLDQAKLGIDAVDAVVDLIDGPAESDVRNAISEIKMIYAKAAAGELPDEPPAAQGQGEPQAGGPGEPSGDGADQAQRPASPADAPQQGSPEGGSKLWTPHQRD